MKLINRIKRLFVRAPAGHDISTVAGYAAAYEIEVARCGAPIPFRDIALFDLVQEECSEVIKERSKLRRSSERAGFRKLSDPNGPTVMQRLASEVYDCMVLFEMLEDRGYTSREDFERHRATKLQRLQRYSPEIF